MLYISQPDPHEIKPIIMERHGWCICIEIIFIIFVIDKTIVVTDYSRCAGFLGMDNRRSSPLPYQRYWRLLLGRPASALKMPSPIRRHCGGGWDRSAHGGWWSKAQSRAKSNKRKQRDIVIIIFRTRFLLITARRIIPLAWCTVCVKRYHAFIATGAFSIGTGYKGPSGSNTQLKLAS